MRLRASATPHDRFLALVEFGDGCWPWSGAVNRDGYGTFKSDLATVLAHRWAFSWWIGEIPEGMILDHRCRNRACVKPTHLEPVSHAENVRRGAAFRREERRISALPPGTQVELDLGLGLPPPTPTPTHTTANPTER